MVTEGSTIGAYRVLHKIGEGGMGVVYVGEHTLLGRKAAIKVLLPELSANQQIVQRFFNEAKAVTQIADPGIVQVFDFGFDPSGSAFIIMEMLDGEPMDRRLRRIGRFSPFDALRLVRLICTSLYAAHLKGVIHRDLKPENIFLVGDPAVTGGERAKILDFGIAKLSHDEPGQMKTRTGTVMGTPVYMSPEQCRGAGEIDHRSDIYSMGCVLMTMLTGRPPFEGSGSGELIVAHMTAQPPLASARVPGLPPVIDQLLQRCLAKDPNQRFATMSELTQACGHAENAMYAAAAPGAGAWPGAPSFRAGPTPPPPGYLPAGPTPPPHGYPGSGATPPPGYTGSGATPPPHGYPGSGAPPPPGGYPAPHATGSPTTLSSMATGGATVAPSTNRRGLMAAIAAIGAVAIAVVVLVVVRGGGDAGRAAHDPQVAGSGGAAQAVPPPAITADAALAAVPPTPAPDSAIAAAVVTASPDAGVVDAAAVVETARDAVGKRPKPPKHTPGSNEHGRATATGTAATVDRGD